MGGEEENAKQRTLKRPRETRGHLFGLSLWRPLTRRIEHGFNRELHMYRSGTE